MAKQQLACLASVVSLVFSSVAAFGQPESSGRNFGGGLTLTQPFGDSSRSGMTVRPWVHGESGGGSGSSSSDSFGSDLWGGGGNSGGAGGAGVQGSSATGSFYSGGVSGGGASNSGRKK